MEQTKGLSKTRYYNNLNFSANLANHYFREIKTAKRILDIGCGVGDFGRLKPTADIDVFGVDCDISALKIAENYEKVELVDLENSNLPYENGFFDAILAKDILEHIYRPWLLVKEMHRVLNINGIAIVNVPMPKPNIVWDDYTHIRGFTKASLKTLFEDYGFEIEYIKDMGDVPLFGKFGLIEQVPYILRISFFNYLFGRTYEMKAKKL